MQRRTRPIITVTLDKKIANIVKELAEKNNRSLSVQVEKLIEQALLLKIDI